MSVVFQHSPEYVSTLAKHSINNPALIEKITEFKKVKTLNPIQPFGKNDTRMVADAPLGKAIPGLRHVHLTQDLSLFYTLSGMNPHIFNLYGIYSHNESGTGNSQNIKVQKNLGKRLANQTFN
jgi:mRNA-degrading endonuclease YafQ of YafQ-DinJ toxin-antitoxin module